MNHAGASRVRSKARVVVAVGLAAALAATGIALAVVLGGEDAPAIALPAPATPSLRDIATEPVVAWSRDLTDGAVSEFVSSATPVAVGDDQALVWATFDTHAWESAQAGSWTWYVDFDAHYDLGVAAGTAFREAEKAADLSYGVVEGFEWPVHEDFWPEQFPGAWDSTAPEYAGFHAGFDDAINLSTGEPGRVQAPAIVDFDPTITLIDLTDGSEQWRVELASIEPEIDHAWHVDAVSLDDGATIAVTFFETFVQEADYRVVATTIATLDAADGSVLSTVVTEENTSIHGVGDALLMMSEGEGGRGPSILRRVDPTALDADPLWERWLSGLESSDVDIFTAGQVSLLDYDSMAVVSLADGAVLWEGEDAVSAGANLLSINREGLYAVTGVEAIDSKGESAWERPLEVAGVWSVDGHVFTAATSVGHEFDPGYATIQRVDPATGEGLWGTPVDKLHHVLGVRAGSVVAIASDRLVLLDPQTGAEKVGYTFDGMDGTEPAWLGTDNVYIRTDDSLLAYSLGADGLLWTFVVPGDASVIMIGQHLALIDAEAGTLSGLGVR